MGRAADHLTVAQYDLLRWVAEGCRKGVYQGTSHRVSARALHNRGYVQVAGRGATWVAKVTTEGTRLLKAQAERVEADRLRAEREGHALAEREREEQSLRESAQRTLDAVVAAGGSLELGADLDSRDIDRYQRALAQSDLLPAGQRLVSEPTRMDPDLGLTAYLEPDWEKLTRPREFRVPRQLRNPHPAVSAFLEKRTYVSKEQIPRAARFLQALTAAAGEVGWKVAPKPPVGYSGGQEVIPDVALSLPSRSVVVSVRELDERGRAGRAFTTETSYSARPSRTVVNKYFAASGRLEVTVSKEWEQAAIVKLSDTSGAPLEDQLSVLIRKLEIDEAEAQWARTESVRRAEIRSVRWKEVKTEAFRRLTDQRNIERLRDEVARRAEVVAMCSYADQVDDRAVDLEGTARDAARHWASWIREHAGKIDPLNGALEVITVKTCSAEELQPHMSGWSAYGPHRL